MYLLVLCHHLDAAPTQTSSTLVNLMFHIQWKSEAMHLLSAGFFKRFLP